MIGHSEGTRVRPARFPRSACPLGGTLIHFLGMVTALLFANALAAREPVEITVRGQGGYPVFIDTLGGQAGATASQALRSALGSAGSFRLASSPAGAYVAAGSAQLDRVDGRLTGPDGRTLFTRNYSSGDLKRDVHRFADDIVEAITGRPGIASTRIVFVATRTGKKELYVCDYDGGNVSQITRDNSISASPSFSPDRDRVAYTSYRGGYPDIYTIDLASGARNRIVNSPGTNSGAAFDPDGRRLALTMSFTGNPELYVVSAGGGRARRLTRSPAVEASPSWFPDGRNLVYVSNESGSPQLYRMSSSGGGSRRLDVGYTYCTAPSVSPDGRRLAFCARTSGGMAVAVYDFETRQSRIISSGGSAEDPSWGADSRHLVYARSGDLYRHDVDGGGATRVVSGLGRISEPSWSR